MKNNKFAKFALTFALCAALICFSACGSEEEIPEESSSESSVSVSESSSSSSSDTVIVVGSESYSDVSNSVGSEASSGIGSEASSSPETESEPAGETEVDAMREYFKTAVFLGNSRTQGLQLYTGLTETLFLAERSMTAKQYNTKEYFTLANGNKGTALQVLQESSFESVYIMYGLNEIGWPNSNAFFNAYRAMIDDIKVINPEAEIYIQSILPVSKSKSEKDEYVNNPRIDAYNETLRQIAEEKGVKYVDVNSHFKNAEGHLPEDVSTDGVHFGPKSCNKWLEILYNNR